MGPDRTSAWRKALTSDWLRAVVWLAIGIQWTIKAHPGSWDRPVGMLSLGLGVASLWSAIKRFRAARSAKTLNSPRKGIEL